MKVLDKLEAVLRLRYGGEPTTSEFPARRYSPFVGEYLKKAAKHGLITRWPSQADGAAVFLSLLRKVGTPNNDDRWFNCED